MRRCYRVTDKCNCFVIHCDVRRTRQLPRYAYVYVYIQYIFILSLVQLEDNQLPRCNGIKMTHHSLSNVSLKVACCG